MRYLIRRFRLRLSRGAMILVLIAGALIAMAFWVGPFRSLPPDLRLMALGSDGRFREAVDVQSNRADTMPPQPDVPTRFPMLLAVYNTGARPATPVRLSLSVPSRFRLANTAGTVYEGDARAGNPLVRYNFEIQPGRVEPRQLPRVLSSLDTLWLEPVIPTYHCTALDSVPEFVPAPEENPESLAHVRIFYSFDARTRARQTGLLSLQIDPELLRRTPPPAPPTLPLRTYEPEYPLPPLDALRQIGTRTARCGDADNEIELYSVLYETPAGSRFFVVHHGGAPRKYLFDMNRDSIIELEVWDPDRDGLFQVGRATRMVIPEFLMPPRRVISAADSAALADSLRTATARVDSILVRIPIPDPNYKFPAPLFGATEGGPFRFWRSLQQARGQLPAAVDTTTSEQAVPRTPRAAPATPREPRVTPPVTRPRPDTSGLLGRPVPYPGQPRRDTVRRDTLPGNH